jgi:MoaA/NifB/PqqE/SkfB family radical SAM enzyme
VKPPFPKDFFDKQFKNEDYEILFNSKNGLEILRGINGKADPFVLELPSLLDIGIMGTCIHKCDVCYQGHTNKANMTLENFKMIIDQVAHHVNQVALGGRGDPNKHENFKEIIEYCREKGVVPNYTTSGIGLTDEEVEISKMCGAVAVSEYQQYYTYQALNKFLDADIKTNIHFIFSRDSFVRAIKIINGENLWTTEKRVPRFSKEYYFDIDKLNAVIFLLFKPQGAGKEHTELIPTEEEFQLFSQLIFNPKCSFKVGMDSCLVNHTLKYKKPNILQDMSIDTCEGARMSAYVSPDMRFTPCSFSGENFGIYISEKNTIPKIWKNSILFDRFRNALKQKQDMCPLGL